jgi:hypothetical protein
MTCLTNAHVVLVTVEAFILLWYYIFMFPVDTVPIRVLYYPVVVSGLFPHRDRL